MIRVHLNEGDAFGLDTFWRFYASELQTSKGYNPAFVVFWEVW